MATEKRRFFRVYVEDFLHDAPPEVVAKVLANLQTARVDPSLPTLLGTGPHLPCLPPFTTFEPYKKLLPTNWKQRYEYITARVEADQEQSDETEGR